MTIEIDAGESIYRAAQKACKLAREKQTEVRFKFNDIELIVKPESFDEDIATIYYLMNQVRGLKSRIQL